MAIGRKTGGRQKGVPNKASAAKAAEIAGSGLTPLDYLLTVLRDPDNEAHTRLDAAKAAAPYVHPKLATIAHADPDGRALGTGAAEAMTDIELYRRIAFALQLGAQATAK